MLLTLIKLLVLTSSYFVLQSKCEELLVSLPQGKLQGVTKASSEGKRFSAFLGIPYAKPPVGELRFEPPEPANPWNGVLNATKPGSNCLQYEVFTTKTIRGSEDCLFLNVYTNNLPISADGKKLPVIVFVHGGGFMVGSGSPDVLFGPEFIMNRDVVLVAINYRVGVLGFLSMANTLISGNMALKDQALALKWVKENIESFGGDSNKIIIYGRSAGAASVHYQMLTPLNKGLFSGVYAMSGTALGKWGFMDEELSKKRAKFIANYVNCPDDLDEETVKCLKEADGHDLMEAVSNIKENGIDVIVSFSPTVESEGSKNIFISERPEEIIRNGEVIDVPLLLGFTSNEGLRFALPSLHDPSGISVMKNDYKSWLLVITEIKERVNDYLTIGEKAKQHYYGEKEVTENGIKELSQLMSDAMFNHCIYKAGLLHMNSPSFKSPLYLFGLSVPPTDRHSLIALAQGKDISDLGVGHGEDVAFNFHTKVVPAISSEKDILVSNHIIDLLVNFAYTGKPDGNNNSGFYKPLTTDFHYTDISYELKEKDDFPLANVKFWETLFTDDEKVQTIRTKEEL